MKKLTLILTTVLLIAQSTLSQDHTVEFLDEQKTTSRGATFIGMDENGYVYARSMRMFYLLYGYVVHNYIKVFNSESGMLITDKRVDMNKELSKMGYSTIRFMLINNKPVFLCRKKGNKDDKDYYLVDLNEKLNLVGSPYKVGYSSDCKSLFKSSESAMYFFEDLETGLQLSVTDKSCKTDDASNLQAVLRDKDNMVVNDFPISIGVSNINQMSSTIYDKNKFYIKLFSLERKKQEGKLFKRTERNHILLAIENDGATTEIDIDVLGPGKYVGAFNMVKSDGQLLFSGQIIDEETSKFLGVFTGKIDPKNDEISDINEQYFESDFVERFWSKKQTKKAERRRNKGKDDDEGFKGSYRLIDYFPTDDGGFVNFYQKYWMEVVTRTVRGPNGTTTTTTDYYYYYTDLIPVKTNKNGDIEWVELIPINQVTVNYDPGTSFLATQKDEDVFIFYNSSNEQDEMLEEGNRSEKRKKRRDRIQKNATIAMISNDGTISFENVIDMREERNVSFNPGSMGKDENNQKIVMINNLKRKRSQLILVGY